MPTDGLSQRQLLKTGDRSLTNECGMYVDGKALLLTYIEVTSSKKICTYIYAYVDINYNLVLATYPTMILVNQKSSSSLFSWSITSLDLFSLETISNRFLLYFIENHVEMGCISPKTCARQVLHIKNISFLPRLWD